MKGWKSSKAGNKQKLLKGKHITENVINRTSLKCGSIKWFKNIPIPANFIQYIFKRT